MKARFLWLLMPMLLIALAGCNAESSDDDSQTGGTDTTQTGGSGDDTQTGGSGDDTQTGDADDDTQTGAGDTDFPPINYASLNNLNGIAATVTGSGVNEVQYVLRSARTDATAVGVPNTYRQLRFALSDNNPRNINYYTNVDQLPPAYTGSTRLTTVTIQVPWAPGTYSCSDDNTFIHINSAWPPIEASTCSIEVEYGTSHGGIAGRIATSSFTSPVALNINNAPFKVYQHRGVAGEAGELNGRGFASLSIDEDEDTFEFPGNQHFILNNGSGVWIGMSPLDGTPVFTGNADDVIRMNVTPGFTNDNGSTVCANSASPRIELRLGRYQHAMLYTTNIAGGSCTFTRTQSWGSGSSRIFSSTYEAVLLASTDTGLTDAQRTVRISGEYANFMLSNEDLGAGNDGNEGALGDTGEAITMLVDNGNDMFTQGHQYRFIDEANTEDIYGFANSGRFEVTATRRYRGAMEISFDLKDIPAEVGTYQCAQTYLAGTATARAPRINLITGQNVNYTTENGNFGSPETIAGASCSITVTSISDQEVQGTYSATLLVRNEDFRNHLADNGSLEISGAFRVEF